VNLLLLSPLEKKFFDAFYFFTVQLAEDTEYQTTIFDLSMWHIRMRL